MEAFRKLKLITLVISFILLTWFVYTARSKEDPVPNIFIGSAHLVDYQSADTPYAVILNTMSDETGSLTTQGTLPLYCLSDKNEKVKTSFRKSDRNRHCLWKNYYIQCDFKHPVNSIQLIDYYGNGVEMSVTKPVQKKIPLVACLSRMFYYDNWQTALAVLEMYHAMGVNELSLHVINVIQDIYDLLELYKKEINLKIYPGYLAPQIAGQDPNEKSESMNHLLCYNECLLNYREAAEFILFADMDDLITSTGGNLYDTVKKAQLQNPIAVNFEFLWKTSSYAKISSPSEFSIPRIFNGLYVDTTETYGKSIVVPKRIDFSRIHNFRGIELKGKLLKSVTLPEQDGFTIHLRGVRKHKTGEYDMKLPTNSTLFEAKTENIQRINEFLQKRLRGFRGRANIVPLNALSTATYNFEKRLRNPSFQRAFNALPTTPFFLPQFIRCYEMFINATKPLCIGTRNCDIDYTNGPKCQVSTSNYVGFKHDKVQVYVAYNRKLEKQETCQLEKRAVELVDQTYTMIISLCFLKQILRPVKEPDRTMVYAAAVGLAFARAARLF
ncbi:unnamed protein product [Bursaphelenchus okinawaensis]|uniref:Glycosyltransferase family 92 protein n=1 Tax=Bursaphelenchus okinawaensis TaxID=465554 RepID=A0A811KF06_9BILA|nr:unnamed protein product [Bursaphelenchus okinawaensis]CAG9103393.1 unnamed protein product [Bursaphelenchus okinawaensis]